MECARSACTDELNTAGKPVLPQRPPRRLLKNVMCVLRATNEDDFHRTIVHARG
jgi:hypothetical protein